MRRAFGTILVVSAIGLAIVGASRTASSEATLPAITVTAPTSIYEFFAANTGVQCEMGRADTSWVKRDYAYCQSVSANLSASFERGRDPKVCDNSGSCLGNPGLNTPRLHVGEVVGSGGLTCAIHRDNVLCRDAAGHGFEMSRDRISVLRP